jgi:uncharacterized membrane protein YfcA
MQLLASAGIFILCALVLSFAASFVLTRVEDPDSFVFGISLAVLLLSGIVCGAYSAKSGGSYLSSLLSAATVFVFCFLLALFFGKEQGVQSYTNKLILCIGYFAGAPLGVKLFAKKPKRRIKR